MYLPFLSLYYTYHTQLSTLTMTRLIFLLIALSALYGGIFGHPSEIYVSAIEHDVESSPSATEEPSPSPSFGTFEAIPGVAESVCIATHHLKHLSASELVFATARSASVLCDLNSSCATAGHIVEFRGRVMTMASYCGVEGVRCTTQNMLVNSPRFVRKWRASSHTSELRFTALAAKYATGVEELVLRAAVHVGIWCEEQERMNLEDSQENTTTWTGKSCIIVGSKSIFTGIHMYCTLLYRPFRCENQDVVYLLYAQPTGGFKMSGKIINDGVEFRFYTRPECNILL